MISGGMTAAYQVLVPDSRGYRQQGADCVRPLDGHRQCDSDAAGAWRAGRRADPGRLRARRSRQEGQGCRRHQRRSREIADRHHGEIRRAEAGHQLSRRGQARTIGCKVNRLFRQRQRRLRLDRDVRQARHYGCHEGQGKKDSATPVGEIVAKGEAEIGFQQIAELRPVSGIEIVGPLPDGLQKITIFSAGIATGSKEPEAGKALIKFLASPGARDALIKSGLEPIPASATH